jgi:hypothetical protein
MASATVLLRTTSNRLAGSEIADLCLVYTTLWAMNDYFYADLKSKPELAVHSYRAKFFPFFLFSLPQQFQSAIEG